MIEFAECSVCSNAPHLLVQQMFAAICKSAFYSNTNNSIFLLFFFTDYCCTVLLSAVGYHAAYYISATCIIVSISLFSYTSMDWVRFVLILLQMFWR